MEHFMPDEFEDHVEWLQRQGHDEREALRRAAWEWRDWWSDSDQDALNRLDPWEPPHLRATHDDSQTDNSE